MTSNNVVCVTSKASDQPVRTHSLIRRFASRLKILSVFSYRLNIIWSLKCLKGGCTGLSESTLVKIPHFWKSYVAAQINISCFAVLEEVPINSMVGCVLHDHSPNVVKYTIKKHSISVGRCVIPCAFFGKSVKHTFSCRRMYPV